MSVCSLHCIASTLDHRPPFLSLVPLNIHIDKVLQPRISHKNVHQLILNKFTIATTHFHVVPRCMYMWPSIQLQLWQHFAVYTAKYLMHYTYVSATHISACIIDLRLQETA